MTPWADAVVYWDASALVALLFRDEHSDDAMECAKSRAVHLLSSLAWAETVAVIARIERERHLAAVLVESARDTLAEGPWRRLHVEPDWELTLRLAASWPLRGADLWHLAAAKTLQTDLPELTMLSFDNRLNVASQSEGLSHRR